ncbi:MAG: hypothetical protein BMS9Abin02_2118 [Anaerolineae bacterium]|nr:MAG: hypothetical protein BMS9Abin02_2118 [Anaerolineae bacterium]
MGAKKIREKHIPMRTCIVCHDRKDKRQLVRIVRTNDSGVLVDPTGKRNGRGAYLCDKPQCWDQALKSKVLDRALKTELSADERQSVYKDRPVE